MKTPGDCEIVQRGLEHLTAAIQFLDGEIEKELLERLSAIETALQRRVTEARRVFEGVE